MEEVIGVRFKNVGKIYYFKPGEKKVKIGDKIIVETSKGIECGTVALEKKEIKKAQITQPLKKIIRIANKNDIKKLEENKRKEKEAFNKCLKKIEKHKLDMKLIDVEYSFDNSKILFYFTAEGRVDFRELVKDLASVFKTRIELRQIGIRDEAKMIGGLGICGRPFCCKTFLGEFHPVSIKMAKEQGLSLSSTKISGTCGRLMCCLQYEQDVYNELLKSTPKIGTTVNTPEGKGVVIEQNLLTGKLTVSLDKNPEAAPAKFNIAEVTKIKDTKAKLEKEDLEELKDIE